MKLIKSTKFTRQAALLIKYNKQLRNKLHNTLITLAENPFSPALFTHKLKGELSDKYAARLTYSLRIVFKFVKEHDEECLLLLSIGSHDEVY